jgi:hypothetical protein
MATFFSSIDGNLSQKWGWLQPPLGQNGVAGATSDFHLFFSIKKKINGQNEVVLGLVGIVVFKPKTM